MIYYGNSTYYNSDFSHYGVKGMKWGVRKKYSLKDHIRKRRQKTATVKKDLGKDYDYYKSLHGKRGTERMYDRAKKKGISYEKSSWLETGRAFAIGEAKSLAYISVIALGYAANKRRVTRGQQWLNRSAPRLASKAYNYDFVTSVGNGVDILQKVGK